MANDGKITVTTLYDELMDAMMDEVRIDDPGVVDELRAASPRIALDDALAEARRAAAHTVN